MCSLLSLFKVVSKPKPEPVQTIIDIGREVNSFQNSPLLTFLIKKSEESDSLYKSVVQILHFYFTVVDKREHISYQKKLNDVEAINQRQKSMPYFILEYILKEEYINPISEVLRQKRTFDSFERFGGKLWYPIYNRLRLAQYILNNVQFDDLDDDELFSSRTYLIDLETAMKLVFPDLMC